MEDQVIETVRGEGYMMSLGMEKKPVAAKCPDGAAGVPCGELRRVFSKLARRSEPVHCLRPHACRGSGAAGWSFGRGCMTCASR